MVIAEVNVWLAYSLHVRYRKLVLRIASYFASVSANFCNLISEELISLYPGKTKQTKNSKICGKRNPILKLSCTKTIHGLDFSRQIKLQFFKLVLQWTEQQSVQSKGVRCQIKLFHLISGSSKPVVLGKSLICAFFERWEAHKLSYAPLRTFKKAAGFIRHCWVELV